MAENVRGDIIDKFNTMASLALQTAIKDRLYEKNGKVWEGYLFSYIDKRATSGRTEDHSYVSMLKDMYGQRKSFSQIDVSSCCTLLDDLDLIRTDREDELVSLIRDKHRNPLQHHVQTNDAKDVQLKEDEIYDWFWKTSSDALREFVEVFSISGRERERILAYCDGSSFNAGSSPNHDVQLRQANEYLASGETERGIEILKRLAEADHGASLLRLANISLDLGKFRDMFDINAAKKYAYAAMRAGAPNAGRIYDDICFVADLAEKAETDCLANIKLFELALEGDLLRGDGKYLCERLIKAEELSPALDIIPLLKKAVAAPARRGKIYIELCRRGEFEFITEYFREKNYSIEAMQKNITRPFNEDWKSYIELFCIFKTKQYSEELLRKNIDFIFRDYNRLAENPPAFFGDFSALLAEAFKALSDLKNEIYCLRRGAELSDNAYCKREYGKYYDEAINLEPVFFDKSGVLLDELSVLYTVNEAFSEDVQKKLAENFWNHIIDNELSPTRSPVWFQLLNTRVSKASALFAYKSPLEEIYKVKYNHASEQSKIIAAEKNRLTHIAELKEILGEKNEAYWDNLSAAEEEAKVVCKRKEENEEVIGEESWEFWRNEARVSRRLEEIAARKEKYDKYIRFAETPVWRSDEAVKERLREMFGSLTDELFADTNKLDTYYLAYRLWYGDYKRIFTDKDWVGKDYVLIDSPDKIDWEFLLDSRKMRLEESAYAVRKKYRGSPEYAYDRSYWLENYEALNEKLKIAEEKEKAEAEKREKAIRRNNTIQKVLSPFKKALSFVAYCLFPPSLGYLVESVKTVFAYLLMCCAAWPLLGAFICAMIEEFTGLDHITAWQIAIIAPMWWMYAASFGFVKEQPSAAWHTFLVVPIIAIILHILITMPLARYFCGADVIDDGAALMKAFFMTHPLFMLILTMKTYEM